VIFLGTTPARLRVNAGHDSALHKPAAGIHVWCLPDENTRRTHSSTFSKLRYHGYGSTMRPRRLAEPPHGSKPGVGIDPVAHRPVADQRGGAAMNHISTATLFPVNLIATTAQANYTGCPSVSDGGKPQRSR
jgi:hypothetical protein